jgi:RNA polymerase sigma-70 factor (ECF subfamily)
MSLREAIEYAFLAGQQALPGIELPKESFAEFAGTRAEHAAVWGSDPERAADLYLVAACVAQQPHAIAEFLSRFGARIPKYLGRLSSNADLTNEVRQIIATRCLVADPDRPAALNSYSGAGSLEGWVRATAVREALALNKRAARETDGFESVLEAKISVVDHEISLFKKVYREPVSRAFVAACGQLAPEHRALLRLHFAQGVTTAQLATMYGISRATAVRRLTEAREALVTLVKDGLKAAIGVTDNDFMSVIKLVNSQLDMRLSMVLKEPDQTI